MNPPTNPSKKRKTRRYLWLISIIVVAAGGLFAASVGRSLEKGSLPTDQPVFDVVKGPLTISVTESGTIKAKEQVILKSEVEGRTTILTLVPEGTVVKKGDLLVELDASQLIDTRVDQQIKVQNAEAAYIRARENLEVVKNQAASDVEKASLELLFASQDLNNFRAGEFPKMVMEADSKITLASETLYKATEELRWSQILFGEKYLSQTKLQEDELAAHRAKVDLELAEADLGLLTDYTYGRNLKQLESDEFQARMALERSERKAKADVIDASADLWAKESEYGRQKDKLKKFGEQIAKAKIHAPTDGLVIYATSARGGFRGNQEPLAEGQEVPERTELIYLPTTSSVKAEIKIHESSLDKVTLGLPARVTVLSVPGRVFTGHVARISPLPDAQSMWMNPDLKVYTTEVYLDGDGSDLKTGMSCSAEILVDRYQEAVYVPVQAVVRVKGKPTVFVYSQKEKAFQPREVETGLDNNRMVRIASGLDPGEKVMLTPPLHLGAVGEPEAVVAKADEAGGLLEDSGSAPPEVRSGSPEMESPPRVRARDGETSEGEPPRARGEDGGRPGGRRREGQRTPEQMEEMRKRLESMSPEERENLRKRFQERAAQGEQQGGQQAPR